jgi:hypothetical protein
MAFTGTPVIQKVTDDLWRLTGVTLAGAASGTIGFSNKTVPANVSIVAPEWKPYVLDGPVSLQDAVKCVVIPAATGITTSVPVSVVKTGTTHLDFVITLTNTTAATLSPSLEIYIEFAGH